ncbi:MAG: hypothetical protein LUH58_02245, partial [Lachnospiraceae bacterium]|nr:hypothetical protein [Lachnospiraceae bacterium]
MQMTKQIRRKMIPAVISMVLAVSLLIGCGTGQEQAGVSSVTESTAESSSIDAASEASGTDSSGENSWNEDNSAISDIYVEAIPNLSDDFIRGMDASSVLAEENSGVVYYNFEGEEQDVF